MTTNNDGLFRKKPVVIEAIQWTGENTDAVLAFSSPHSRFDSTPRLVIRTLEGNHYANVGDWIIKGVKGEFYPCKPDIFEATYEPAAPRPPAPPAGERAELIQRMNDITRRFSEGWHDGIKIDATDIATLCEAAALLEADGLDLDVQAGSIDAVQAANVRLAARVAELKADAQRPSRWPAPLAHHDDKETPEQAWEFWKGIVLNADGSVNVEQLKLELSDFSMLMRYYGIVLCDVTGGRISKENTHPSAICQVFGDYLTERVEEAVKDAMEESAAQRPARMPLTEIDALAKVYSSSYASPHHITFTVEDLRRLIEAAHGIKEQA